MPSCLKTGKKPTFVNSFGHLSVINQTASAMSLGNSLGESFWFGSVFKASSMLKRYICLLPPQSSSIEVSAPIFYHWNHVVVDGANVIRIPGEPEGFHSNNATLPYNLS